MKCGRRRLFVLVLVLVVDVEIEADCGPITRTTTRTRTMEPASVARGAGVEGVVCDSEASEQLFGVRLDLRCGILRRQNLREAALDAVAGWTIKFAKAEEVAGIRTNDGEEFLLLPGARFAHKD